MVERRPTVDFHIHVAHRHEFLEDAAALAASYGGNGMERQWGADGEVDVTGLLAHLDAEGIDHACLIPSGAGLTATLDLAAGGGGRLHPFVTVDPRTEPDAAAVLDGLCDRGAAGLKIHPVHMAITANDPALYPLYEVAGARGIPVMLHIGSSVFPGARHRFADPLAVDEAAEDFPGVDFVCAHAGRGFWEEQTFFLARLRSNVHLELSGMPAARIAVAFPELDRIRDRVLFGSDWPTSPALSVVAERFRALPFAPETLRAATWDNPARLLGLTG